MSHMTASGIDSTAATPKFSRPPSNKRLKRRRRGFSYKLYQALRVDGLRTRAFMIYNAAEIILNAPLHPPFQCFLAAIGFPASSKLTWSFKERIRSLERSLASTRRSWSPSFTSRRKLSTNETEPSSVDELVAA